MVSYLIIMYISALLYHIKGILYQFWQHFSPFSEKRRRNSPLSPLYAPGTCARTSDPSASVRAAAGKSAVGASRVGRHAKNRRDSGLMRLLCANHVHELL
jgi:hypothetical protein